MNSQAKQIVSLSNEFKLSPKGCSVNTALVGMQYYYNTTFSVTNVCLVFVRVKLGRNPGTLQMFLTFLLPSLNVSGGKLDCSNVASL